MVWGTWTSKMAKTMDPILPIVSVLGYWATVLGSFGGPGRCLLFECSDPCGSCTSSRNGPCCKDFKPSSPDSARSKYLIIFRSSGRKSSSWELPNLRALLQTKSSRALFLRTPKNWTPQITETAISYKYLTDVRKLAAYWQLALIAFILATATPVLVRGLGYVP